MMSMRLIKSIIFHQFEALFRILYPLFRHQPSVIGTPFYEARLLSEISFIIRRMMQYFRLEKRLPQEFGIGLSERCVEIPWFFSRLDKKVGLHLDAGSSLNFAAILKLEPLRRKKIIIANFNPEVNCYWEHSVSYLFWDIRSRIFDDEIFDTISCISVLEHIGMDTSGWTHKNKQKEHKRHDYQEVVSDFHRILKKGGNCYITVPYGRYTDHGWLQVFNKSLVNQIIDAFQPMTYTITYFMYTKDGWMFAKEQDCAKCSYSKSYLPNYTVGAESVACIHMTK